MRSRILTLATVLAAVNSGGFASGQIHTAYSPYVPIVAPTGPLYSTPMVVARPAISAPTVISPTYAPPVVSVYRPIVPTYTVPTYTVPTYTVPTYSASMLTTPSYTVPAYTAPTTVYRPVLPAAAYSLYPSYSTYRPVVPATVPAVVPVAPATVPVYSAASVYRPGVVGTGIGGVPTVYTPGQPLRNMLRYIAP